MLLLLPGNAFVVQVLIGGKWGANNFYIIQYNLVISKGKYVILI